MMLGRRGEGCKCCWVDVEGDLNAAG